MDLDLGETLTRWTVRIAVACYLVRVVIDLLSPDLLSTRSRRAAGQLSTARGFWTAGCAFYIAHVVCAFVFYHEWSHLSAYRHTARQTAAVVGIHWGGGLYFNYVFTVLWLSDVVAWWLHDVDLPYRSTRYFWALHGVFAFMMFNATIVFGPPLWKSTAPVIAVVLLTALFLRSR